MKLHKHQLFTCLMKHQNVSGVIIVEKEILCGPVWLDQSAIINEETVILPVDKTGSIYHKQLIYINHVYVMKNI